MRREVPKIVLRGALVVDGTGSPAFHGDVTVSGGTIRDVTAPGEASTASAEVIDLSGLVLAPGFIDIHTHYDAQVMWDPDLTPSSWHGITSVVMGNCGFGIAPTRPAGRETIIQTLENVEGMSADALRAGIDWTFETFPEYLAVLSEQHLRLNVAAFVGHSPVRLYVMGREASERAATPAEVAEIRSIVVEALRAGSIGVATSQVPVQVGAGGRPVPSRLADAPELHALAEALAEVGAGLMEVAGGPRLGRAELVDLAARSGRPVCVLGGAAEAGESVADRLTRFEASGLWAQTACRPFVFQVTMLDPFPFGTIPAFQEVLAAPRTGRRELYDSEVWRARARQGWDGAMASSPQLGKIFLAESKAHPQLAEESIIDLAERAGVHPLDVLLDLALADSLESRFRIVFGNDDPVELSEVLRDDRVLIGLSDAGAHASQICDAVFTTSLLQEWVRDAAS